MKSATWLQKHQTEIVVYSSYLIIAVFFLFPVLWAVSLSIRTSSEIFTYPPKLIPSHPTLENYLSVWQVTRIPLNLFNSVKIVFFAVLGSLFVSVPAAFAFSRFRFRAKKQLLLGILLFQMISPLVVAIPIYTYFAKLGLLDTHFGVIMVYIAIQIPFTTWLLKGFFDSISKNLDDAAKIDGCNRIRVLAKIILPLASPGIAAAIIFNSIISWGQFIIPLILLQRNDLQPISVGVLTLQGTYMQISTHLIAAGSVYAMMPAIALFVILQRFIVQVLTAGAVKG